MTISLDGVSLQKELILEQDLNYPAAAQTVKYTILGSIIIQSSPLSGGEEYYLTALREGNNFTGWFTREQIESFKILEAQSTIVEFIYGTRTFNVIIKSGGVNVVPLIPSSDISSSDKYTGTITLIRVE